MSLSDNNESSKIKFENDNKNKNEGDLTTDKSTVDLNKDYDPSNDYNFGWNRYSEITNGRFAMIGLLSILIIEIISKKSFFSWAGILN
tara:strand:- start:520 stop:783 length:264 start_codon:yes stop_codon:yes gene_type:complete